MGRPSLISPPCVVSPSLLAAGLLLTGACNAVAQTQGPESAAELPVIIVTPEWRPVDAQSVPKTINVLSAESLSRAGLHDTIDLQQVVPGFVFKTNSVLGQPYLRGVGSDFISAGAESSVATFVDGVYLPRAFDTIVDFFDLERVEVIKGPQAVHLGRNVVGGAVSVNTADPGFERAGYLDLELGDYARRRVRGAADIPLGDGPFALRIAGSAAERDGYTDNVFLNTDVNGENFHAWRAKLLYAPGDDLSLVVGVERHREDSTRATGSQPVPGLGLNGGIALGGIVPADPRLITENVRGDIAVRSTRVSARLRASWNDFDLLSTTAYVETDAALSLDLDGTNADFASNHPSGSSRALMQELRLMGDGKRWSWTAGTFLLDEDADQALDVRLPQTGTRSLPDADVATRSWALFGEAAYRFSTAWRGRVGFRYTQDAREIDLVRVVASPAGTAVFTQNESGRWSGATPELGVEYTPREDRLYFASVARGYKAGGYNTSTIQAAFDSEFLVAYEVGIKTTLPRHGLRVNASLFHYDYDDMQLNTPPTDAPVGAFPRVINAAESSVDGVDVEVLLRPGAGNFGLAFGATLLEAQFDEFVSIDPNNPTVDPDRAGNRMPQAPEASLNLRADYGWPLRGGSLTLTGEYRRQSSVWFNIYEDPALRHPGYALLGASLAFESSAGSWYAELWSRNLSDELFAQTILRNDPYGGVKRLWGAPRTFGVRAGYRW
jgi:iron complex outermembrane recepter protein